MLPTSPTASSPSSQQWLSYWSRMRAIIRSKTFAKDSTCLGSKAFSSQAIKDTIEDRALTLEVHLWKLGVPGQDHGNASVSERLNVSCRIAQDLFDPDKLEKRRIVGSEAPIPSCIYDLKVTCPSTFKSRAIFVVEHRNLDFTYPAVAPPVTDVIIIQVRPMLRPLATSTLTPVRRLEATRP